MNIRKTIFLLFPFHLLAFFGVGQATRPELIVQTGHTNTVGELALSPDGRLLATASSDTRIKLWNIRTGLELRSLSSSRQMSFDSLVFTSDNSKIIAVGGSRGTADLTVRVWDVTSGRETGAVSGKFDHVAISPDGLTFAASGDDQVNIRIFSTTDGRELRSLTGPDREVEAITYSPDGKTIASGNQNLVVLWDFATGKIIRTLTGHDLAANSVAFSGDGQTLVSCGADGLLKVWDVVAGTNTATYQQELKESHYVSISRDGKVIAAEATETLENSFRKVLIVLDRATGKTLRKLTNDSDGSFLLGPNGTHVFAGDAKGVTRQISINSGSADASFSGRSEAIYSLAFGPDSDEIATGSRENSVVRWKSGRVPQMLSGHTNSVASVGFSKDGNNLISASWDKTVRVWSGAREVFSLKGHTAEVQSLAVSPDGRLIASGARDKTIRLWDAATGRLVKTLIGHLDEYIRPGFEPGDKPITSPGRVMGLCFSPDSRSLFSVGSDNTIKLWNIAAGKMVRSTSTGTDSIFSLALSPDGKTIATGGFRMVSSDEAIARADVNGTLVLWDAATGKMIREFKGISDWIFSAAFSSDSKTVVTGSLDNKVQLWDVSTGGLLRDFPGISGSIFAVGFSPDGRFIATGCEDGAVQLWNAASGKELGSLIKFGDNDWLVVTPDGFFDGTPAAWKQLFWRFNNDTFDTGAVELYFNDFFHPNLLQDILAGNPPKPKSGQELESIDRRQPTVSIISAAGMTAAKLKEPSAASKTIGQRTIPVTIEVSENTDKPKIPSQAATSGAQDLRLFRNGSLVRIWHGDLFGSGIDGCVVSTGSGASRRIRCQADIPVTAGGNDLTAYAFNSSNVKSNDDMVSITGADSLKRPGTLYVLAVGINKYAESAYNLNFAVPDVEEMSIALKLQQAKLSADPRQQQYAKTEVIGLTNENATKSNIMLALRRFSEGNSAPIPANAAAAFKDALSKIKAAEPEDAVLLYYAGHGTSRGPRFYLLPHDFTGKDETALITEGLSDIELNTALEKVDAGRLMMVIDACQSGQALGATNEGRAPMNSKGLAQLAYDKGMSILTAAQSQQAALEVTQIAGKEIRHGLLTYALLTGLASTEADKDRNKRLSDREWIDYAAAEVPQLQVEAMKKRHADIQKTGRGIEIIFVNGDKAADPQKRGVQTPRVFYRRDTDPFPLILAGR